MRAARGTFDIVLNTVSADIPVAEIGLRLPSLDDVFLALTGHTAEEAA